MKRSDGLFQYAQSNKMGSLLNKYKNKYDFKNELLEYKSSVFEEEKARQLITKRKTELKMIKEDAIIMIPNF